MEQTKWKARDACKLSPDMAERMFTNHRRTTLNDHERYLILLLRSIRCVTSQFTASSCVTTQKDLS